MRPVRIQPPEPSMSLLPSLFISHGAPTLAIDDTATHRFLKGWMAELPRPEAILVLSAHWDTAAPRASAAERPETIHDFGGFPEALYRLRYAAPGAPALATEAVARLADAGLEAATHPDRGLDHGAWVPLMLMLPGADVPVTQLSIQSARGPAHAWAVGEALAPLREAGVLIVGSGAVTHNLREWWHRPEDAAEEAWAGDFADWIAAAVEAGDRAALLDYRAQAPHAVRNHPTDEHLLPLFSALAAAQGQGRRVHRAMENGVLSMDCYVCG